MKQTIQELGTEHHAVIEPGGRPGITPRDTGTGSASPMRRINSVVGFVTVSFDFFNEGGTNNLLPGRPTTKAVGFDNPENAGCFIVLNRFESAFVTDGRVHLTARPLGDIKVSLGLVDNKTASCTVRLTDDNADDPVVVTVTGFVILFR